jgi:hypothetical protein
MGYRALRIAALILCFSADSTSAETIWDVIQRFGWTGMWSAACNHRPTRTNFREILSGDPTGLGRREIDRGEEIPVALSFVDSAKIVSPRILKGRVRNADPNWEALNNLTYDIVIIKEVDPLTEEIARIRYIDSIRSDGKVIAKGGILLAVGKPTFWEYRCHNEVAESENSLRQSN